MHSDVRRYINFSSFLVLFSRPATANSAARRGSGGTPDHSRKALHVRGALPLVTLTHFIHTTDPEPETQR